MLWSRLDNDLINDHEFITLEDQIPGGFWMFIHCLTFARIANNQGRILHRGVPMQVKNFATVTRQPVERWANFFEEAFALGILVQTEYEDALCFQVADWGRWHLPPSALPEATRERVRKHRESKLSSNVTSCNELSRDVTDVTTHSTAQHSTAENSTAENSIEQQSTEQQQQSTENDVEVFEDEEGRDELAAVFQQVSPGALSQKFCLKLGNFRRTVVPNAVPEDYVTAARYAVEEVRWMWRQGRAPTSPRDYALGVACNHLMPAVERRLGNEARAKQGFSTAPYVWEPPKEEKQSA